MMDRRSLLASGATMIGGMVIGSRTLAAAPSLQSVARDAWLYTVPLVEVANVRKRILANGPANAFVHNRDLTNVRTQKVTSPNNDTMYSRAMLDLRAGPVEVTLPPTGTRYISLQLVDMYTNNIAVLGSRTTGGGGGRFVVAGPQGDAPVGAIRAPSNWVFALVRTLVDGPSDVVAVRAVQDGLAIRGAAGPALDMPVPARDAPWQVYFRDAGALLVESPPPVTDDALFGRVAPLGLSRTGFRPPAFSDAAVREIEAGVAEARSVATQSRLGKQVVGGWAYPSWDLGRFEQDYEFRAQTAVSGLFALPLEEAFYTRSVGDSPDGLFRNDRYHLHFAKDALPPVDGFWSVTLYEATPDGQLFFTPNAIDRYSIGNRTTGLAHNADGSLDVWIARADPGAARRSNWLPAPREKPFALSMRAFMPRAPLLNGTYRFPPLRRYA
ncbi:MAG: DUF1254 domain-containing protein [Proteobacteria bacterium]|nr:DUF1254 domain-containing protein [Pseudomonadota bacterium]